MGADLEVGCFMISILRFRDMDLGIDMYAEIRLKIIQKSTDRVINLKLWRMMWKTRGQNIDQEQNRGRRLKGKGVT